MNEVHTMLCVPMKVLRKHLPLAALVLFSNEPDTALLTLTPDFVREHLPELAGDLPEDQTTDLREISERMR